MYFHNHDFKRKKVTDDKKKFHVHVHDRSKAGLRQNAEMKRKWIKKCCTMNLRMSSQNISKTRTNNNYAVDDEN